MEGETSWSLGILIGLPVAAAIFLLFVGLAFLTFRFYNRDSMRDGFVLFTAWALVACAITTIVVTAVWTYPYKYEYHQYVTKVGTVKEIKSRLLGSSNSFQQKFVAEYTDGRLFGCEDTRCALVKPGDILVLACKRQWQYTGVDGYDCNFIRNETP